MTSLTRLTSASSRMSRVQFGADFPKKPTSKTQPPKKPSDSSTPGELETFVRRLGGALWDSLKTPQQFSDNAL